MDSPPSGANGGGGRSLHQAATTVAAVRAVSRRTKSPVVGRVVGRSPAAVRTGAGTAAAGTSAAAVRGSVKTTASVAATLKARSAAAASATAEADAAARRLQAENDALRARIEALESPRELPRSKVSVEEPELEPEPEPEPASPQRSLNSNPLDLSAAAVVGPKAAAVQQSPELAAAHKLKAFLPSKAGNRSPGTTFPKRLNPKIWSFFT